MKYKSSNKSNIDNAQESKNEELDREYYNNIKNCATDLQNLSLNFFPSINTYNCIPKLNAINAITFHPCISSKDYFNNTYSFKPLFTHHFFSDSEQVIGFDSLKIDFYYTCDNCEVFMKLRGCICDQYENSNQIMLMLLQNLYITTPYPGGFIETEEEFLSILNRNEKSETIRSNKIKKNIKENFQNGIYKPPGFIIYEKKISDEIILQIRKCGFSSIYFKKDSNEAIKSENSRESSSCNSSNSIYDRLSKRLSKNSDTNKNDTTSNKNNDKNKINSHKADKSISKVNVNSNNKNTDNKACNNGNVKVTDTNKKKENDNINKVYSDKNNYNKIYKNENFKNSCNSVVNNTNKVNDKKNGDMKSSSVDLNAYSNDISSSPTMEKKKNEKANKETKSNKGSDSDNVFVENKKLKKSYTKYITEKDMSKLYREYLHILKEKKKKENLTKEKEYESNINNDNSNNIVVEQNNNNKSFPSEKCSVSDEMEEKKEGKNKALDEDNNNKYDYTVKDNFELLHRKVEWFYHWFIESASNIEYDYRWSVILPYIVFKYDNNNKFSENFFIEKLNNTIFSNNNYSNFDLNNIKQEKLNEYNKKNEEKNFKCNKEITGETKKEKEQGRKLKEVDDKKDKKKRNLVINDDDEKKTKKKKKKIKKTEEDVTEEIENKEEKYEKDKKNKDEINKNNNNIVKSTYDGKEYVLTNEIVKQAIEDTLNNIENKKEEDYYSFHKDYDVVYLYSDLIKKNEEKEEEKKKRKKAVLVETEENKEEKNISYYFYLFGLATTYTFFTFQFDRNRISQFLIFPPMQNKGLGMKVLEKIYHLSIINRNIREITVEDPAVSFTQLRDIITIKICIDLKILPSTILYPEGYLKTKNIKKESIELDKKRFMKVCKETHKQITRMIETLLLASVLPHPAPLYMENEEKNSIIRKKEKKNENLNYVNSMEYFESSDLCKDVRIKIKKRIKNDYIGNLINKNTNCMASDVFRDYVKEELYKLWKKQCKVYYRTIKKLRSLYPL